MPRFDELWSMPESENLYELTKELEPGPLLFGLEQNHLDFYHTLCDWLELPHQESCYRFLSSVAYPMWRSFKNHKEGNEAAAQAWANKIDAPDWRYAVVSWLHRRGEK
jgi:hypothetical protein